MHLKSSIALTALLAATASPALAHPGHHGSGSLLSTIGHFMGHPDHFMPLLIGGFVVVAGLLAFRRARKKRRG